jgi:hypothetical protein
VLVLVHDAPQRVGAPAEQPDVHVNEVLAGLQTGAWPVHFVPQAPQLSVAEKSTSHPSFGLAEQCPYPAWHWTTHWPLWHATFAPFTCGSAVQSLAHDPHVWGSLADEQPASQ